MTLIKKNKIMSEQLNVNDPMNEQNDSNKTFDENETFDPGFYEDREENEEYAENEEEDDGLEEDDDDEPVMEEEFYEEDEVERISFKEFVNYFNKDLSDNINLDCYKEVYDKCSIVANEDDNKETLKQFKVQAFSKSDAVESVLPFLNCSREGINCTKAWIKAGKPEVGTPEFTEFANKQIKIKLHNELDFGCYITEKPGSYNTLKNKCEVEKIKQVEPKWEACYEIYTMVDSMAMNNEEEKFIIDVTENVFDAELIAKKYALYHTEMCYIRKIKKCQYDKCRIIKPKYNTNQVLGQYTFFGNTGKVNQTID